MQLSLLAWFWLFFTSTWKNRIQIEEIEYHFKEWYNRIWDWQK